MNKVILYTDGGCSPNPGEGSIGIYMKFEDGVVKTISNYFPFTTNNQMELMAFIVSLDYLTLLGKSFEIDYYSDSQYLINTLINGWKRNKNIILWNIIDKLIVKHKVNFNKVKAHSDNKLNNIVDSLCHSARKDKIVDEKYNNVIKRINNE
jgi:ribonuclease HI